MSRSVESYFNADGNYASISLTLLGGVFKTSNGRYSSGLSTAFSSAHFANIFSACMAATPCEPGKTFRNLAHAASLFLSQRESLLFWALALTGVQAFRIPAITLSLSGSGHYRLPDCRL